MPSYIETCVDEYNNIHTITKVLSQGGQGIVYRTRDADVAIKFVTDDNGSIIASKQSVASYQEKFRKLRLLPVPQEANITFPVALLSGQAGYVMYFLTGMSPASTLCINSANAADIKEEEIPEWLKDMDVNAAKQFTAYCKTGGLRRRLYVLYKIASRLAMLHGVGLVYGDISSNNVFISDNGDDYGTWFIDADNLKYEGEAGAVYTPRYGAPELVQERADGTMASDCHAFAVLAYSMLTMIHPFLDGKKVLGTTSDWADTDDSNEDPETQALKGYYPWVRDKDDDSNSSDAGLPHALLFDKELDALFQETFGKGRLDPLRRPVIFHWPFAFLRAADSTIECPACKMSYRYDYAEENGAEQCLYCGNPKPAFVFLEVYAWENGSLGEKLWIFAREIDNSGIVRFPARVFSLSPLIKNDMPVLEIEIKETSVLFKKTGETGIDFSIAVRNINQGKFESLLSQMRFKSSVGNIMLDIADFIIFAEADGFSRLIRCSIKGGIQ
jgi:serine/threonine protein kinase